MINVDKEQQSYVVEFRHIGIIKRGCKLKAHNHTRNMIIAFNFAPVKEDIFMNAKLYRNFVQELIDQGIRVQNLTLKQISKSIELYKIINR